MQGDPTNKQQFLLSKSSLLSIGSFSEFQWESIKKPTCIIQPPETQGNFQNFNMD